MKKNYLLLLILICCNSFAQQYIKSDIEAEKLFEASKAFRYSNADSIRDYALRIKKLGLSQKIIAFEKATLSFYYSQIQNYSETEINGKKALTVFQKYNFQKHIAFIKSIIGRSWQGKSDYVQASNYYFQSNKIAEKNQLNETLIFNFKNLSFLFLDQKDLTKSKYYIKEAEKIALETNNKIELGFINGIYAEIYRTEKNNEKAQMYFKKSFEIFENKRFNFGIAWTLTNWSIVETNSLKQQFEMQTKAQKIWDKSAPNNVMSIANQYNIGYIFFELYQKGNKLRMIKNFNVTKNQLLDSTFYYFDKSLKIAEKQKIAIWRMYCYGSLNAFYFYKKDLIKYDQYTEKYHELKDSIFSQESKNAIAKLESQKEIDKKNQQIKINNLALEAKEKQKLYLLCGLGLLTIIGGLLFYQSRKRKLNNLKLGVLNKTLDQNNIKLETLNKDLDQANKAKTRFFGILNHDLRGPVANLINFLQLQKESPEMLDEASTKRMQDKTMTGAENLLASMEDILQWSKSQMENFKPQPKKVLVNQLFEDTKKVFSGYLNIKFEYQNPDNIEIFTDDNYLKTIIRNLTSNAINVFVNIENPKIIWKAWQENAVSYLSITDNGPGAYTEKLKALFEESEVSGTKSGLGLHLIRDMSKAIQCDISVESEIGFGTTFTLKL